MEMTQLELFLRVIEEGSFSKAADVVGRTQPTRSARPGRRANEGCAIKRSYRGIKIFTLAKGGRRP